MVSGRLVIMMPGKIVKDVQKYNILSGRVAITFCNSYARQICQGCVKKNNILYIFFRLSPQFLLPHWPQP